MIGEDELALLDGGYVVNCARGGIIDEPALAEAVEDGVRKALHWTCSARNRCQTTAPSSMSMTSLSRPICARRRRPHRRTSPPPRPTRLSLRPTASPLPTP